MKKILMIAYHFHPDLAIGAQRTIKYAKYLPEFGWQPYILTVDSKKYIQKDNSPLEFDCPVYRSSQWLVPDDIYMKLIGLLRKNEPVSEAEIAKTIPLITEDVKSERSFLQKFAYTISTTPDQAIGWFIPAVLEARKIIRKNKIDLIYTSGPPQTCHLTGYVVSKLTGLPLVLDFRDPWFHEKRHYHKGLPVTKSFDKYFEKRVVKHASLIITTCNEWRDALKKTYQPYLDNKCHAIVNGFDQDDFRNIPLNNKNENTRKFTFLYAGSLYSGRDPYNLFKAIGELLKEKYIFPEGFHLDFYGNIEIDMSENNRLIDEYQLSKLVTFHKSVKRSSYLQLLTGANVLIMFQSDEARVNIPGKAFEYLAVGNDILCLTSEGATKNFLSAYDHVAIASLNDTEQIKQAIKKIVKQFKSEKGMKKQSADLTSITKKYLAEKFAGLLTYLFNNEI